MSYRAKSIIWTILATASQLGVTTLTLKTYKGFAHGMPSTEAATINADLLAFIKS
jgi:hypothetical protein